MEYIYDNADSIMLRKTLVMDLDFIIASERNPENALYVGQWTRDRHLESLEDEDIFHMVIEDSKTKTRIGYVIMAGLNNPSRSIEFRRIVVCSKGNGHGKETIRLIKHISFKQLNAHRLWLDVRLNNKRAQHVYKEMGFKEEGLLRECIYCNGQYESLMVMSILENEYGVD